MKYIHVDMLPESCQVKFPGRGGNWSDIECRAQYAASSIPEKWLPHPLTEGYCAADGSVGYVLPAGMNADKIQRFLWNLAAVENKHTPEEYEDLMRLSCRWRASNYAT